MATIYVMNAATGAPSEYHDLSVIALAALDGAMYGIQTSGLLEFTGTDDEGTDIDAYVETGKMKIGGGILKRYPRLYLGGTADGGMNVTVTTEESGVEVIRRYPKAPWKGDLRERVTKLAGGAKSRYVKVKMANRNGGSFKLDQADLAVSGLPGRRV